MSEQEHLDRIRHSVCAIGCVKVPPAKYSGTLEANEVEIHGSGFVVDSQRAVTCAHVLTEMAKRMKQRNWGLDRTAALFAYPDPKRATWNATLVHFEVSNLYEETDIALLRLGHAVPVEGAKVFKRGSPGLAVGEAIGLVSYAHGSELLYRGKTLARLGPLLQRGFISALSPHDSDPTEMLLDLVTAPAASGGPVFRIDSGEVIGILQSGQIGSRPTTSVAIPIFYDGTGVGVPLKGPVGMKLIDTNVPKISPD